VNTLLVVDNCEHLLKGAAEAVQFLLERCPGLRVLATSRETLRLPGETVWRLGPLLADDALDLFMQRAEALRPGVASGSPAAIERLCARLDGMPLALELAAGRVSSLSPEMILERLGDRLDLLTSRARGAPARHRSLRATIEWSAELLSESERLGFTRLALFPGSFSLDAADAVAAVGLDELDGLVQKSLVSTVRGTGTEIRYRMLDTIRAYARQSLEVSGEQDALRGRHLAFYIQRAEAIHAGNALGGSDAEVSALAEDLPNLRLAVAWATEHDPEAGLRLMGTGREAWFARNQTEGAAWVDRLLAGHELPDRARALGLLCAGRLSVAHQEHDAGRRLLDETVTLAEALDDRSILAPALHYRGISGMLSRRLDQAEHDLDRSIELFRELRQPQVIGRGLGVLGFVHLYRGDPAAAERIFENALDTVTADDDAWGIGQVSLGLGLTAKASGQTTRAIEHLTRAAASLAAAGDATILGVALSTFAGLTLERYPQRALRLAGAATALRSRIGGAYPPPTAAELDAIRERGADLLGPTEAEGEWSAGQSLDAAACVALIEGRRPPHEPGTLTVRQREVAGLVAEGMTNAQIAARLHLAERTVENHVFNALSTLGLHNRVQLATWMIENGAARQP
jgi:predicted ATPase/DNA-binding CsgD family transcriptional regulator